MLVLIYGANGWIGKQFTKYLDQNNVEWICGESRVDNVNAVIKELFQKKPTHVVSLIGRTSGVYQGKVYNTIDYLEQRGNLNLNIRDNLFGPMILAILCKDIGIHLTYLGTGCIFNYNQTHTASENGWTEEDTPNFTGSSYSTVKGYTDRLMHLFNDTVLNLRIRMPISKEKHPRNFITKITGYSQICSIPNSMTVLHTFFPVWVDMMKNKVTGTWNCTNPGVISHNEILTMYRDIVDQTFSWENCTLEEQSKILDSDRSNNYLDTSKLSSLYPILDIHTAVRETLLCYHAEV